MQIPYVGGQWNPNLTLFLQNILQIIGSACEMQAHAVMFFERPAR